MKKMFIIPLMCMMLLTLAACGGGRSGDKLIMATNATFPPYEYYEGEEGKGKIVGIDAEVAALIAQKLGMTLEIMDIEFDSIITAVQSGKADIGMAGMTVTEDRLQSINFSISYATGVQVVIVREDGPIQSVDDLSNIGGFIIGVQTSTTGDIYASEDFEDMGLGKIDRYNKGTDAVLALTTGKVDCVIIDNEPAKSFVAANTGLKILDTEYIVEEYAICIAKNNTNLLEKVNAALSELIADGSIQKVINKYISAN
jgi:polar amino acid transport system substrate-binding protein